MPHIIYSNKSTNFCFLICRTRGAISCVGSMSRQIERVDHVESRSTRSLNKHVLNSGLSEIIRTVRSRVITVQIIRITWTSDQIWTTRSRSNGRSYVTPLLLHMMRMHLDPSSAIQRSSDEDDDSWRDVSSRSLIVMSPSDRTAELIFISLKSVLRDGKESSMINHQILLV